MADEATKYLEEQELKLQEALAEQEKRKKQKKQRKGEEEKDVDPAEYKHLPKDLLERMLRKRLQEDDCNAGAIFDQLTSEQWPDEKFAIELICDAVPRQKVELVLFNFNREDQAPDSDRKLEVCTNYRYARRHDPAHMPKGDETDKKPSQDE